MDKGVRGVGLEIKLFKNCVIKVLIAFKAINGMSSIGYLGRFFETGRTAW
jgi:hypothetical protein